MSVPVHLPPVPSPADQTFPWPCSAMTAAPSVDGTPHNSRIDRTMVPSRQGPSRQTDLVFSRAWLSPSHPGVPRSHWHNNSSIYDVFTSLYLISPHFPGLYLQSFWAVGDFPVYRLTFKHQKIQKNRLVVTLTLWMWELSNNRRKALCSKQTEGLPQRWEVLKKKSIYTGWCTFGLQPKRGKWSNCRTPVFALAWVCVCCHGM